MAAPTIDELRMFFKAKQHHIGDKLVFWFGVETEGAVQFAEAHGRQTLEKVLKGNQRYYQTIAAHGIWPNRPEAVADFWDLTAQQSWCTITQSIPHSRWIWSKARRVDNRRETSKYKTYLRRIDPSRSVLRQRCPPPISRRTSFFNRPRGRSNPQDSIQKIELNAPLAMSWYT